MNWIARHGLGGPKSPRAPLPGRGRDTPHYSCLTFRCFRLSQRLPTGNQISQFPPFMGEGKSEGEKNDETTRSGFRQAADRTVSPMVDVCEPQARVNEVTGWAFEAEVHLQNRCHGHVTHLPLPSLLAGVTVPHPLLVTGKAAGFTRGSKYVKIRLTKWTTATSAFFKTCQQI